MAHSKIAIHPGNILLTEFMEPLNLTSYRLAKEIGVPLPRVNDIVREKRSITVDTAMRLSAFFGNSAQFWMNLQTFYDLKTTKVPGLEKIKQYQAA